MANGKTSRVLASGRLQIARFKNKIWFAQVENGVTLDDLLDHGFWVHKPQHVDPYNEIVVYPEGGEWRAHLHVIEADEMGLVVDVISFVKFERVEAMREAGGLSYRIKSAGPGKGYMIERADGVTIGGFASRAAAAEHLRNSAPSLAKSA